MTTTHGDKHPDETFITKRTGPHGSIRPDISRWLREYNESKAADRYQRCGGTYYVHGCKCGTLDISGSRCENKLCPECSEKKYQQTFARNAHIKDRFPENQKAKYRLVMIHINPPNIEDNKFGRKAIQDYHKHITKFFNHPDIKKVIRGDLTAIEVTRPFKKKYTHEVTTDPNRSWNLHSHTMAEADRLDMNLLFRTWYEIAGYRTRIVVESIRSKYEFNQALGEVIKYITKPPNLGEERSYARYYVASKGLKLLTSRGSFRKGYEDKQTEIFEPTLPSDEEPTKEATQPTDDKPKTKPCPCCDAQMEYLFSIKPKEALRWREWALGAPTSYTGYSIKMGFPRSFEAVGRALNCVPTRIYIDDKEIVKK